jgi:predicted glycosyltransferase
MRRRTIVFQPPNHIGLGHISRLLAIALAVRELDPQLRLPFIVGGHAHGLVEGYGLPHLSLPDSPYIDTNTRWSEWAPSEQHDVAVELATAMVRALHPDLIVFDCFPHHAMVEVALRYQLPVVFSLRKLKDMSFHFAAIRQHQSLVRAILIPHGPHECDVPDDLRSRTCFTGPVTRPLLPPGRARAHAAGATQLVITGGGGGYPGTVDFYNLALEASARLREKVPALERVLVTGPLFHQWWDLRLVNDVRVLPFDPQLSSRLAEADIVMCQGGYNTMAEIVTLGVPAICVPAERGADDQFARARELASPITKVYTGRDPRALSDMALALLHARSTRPHAVATAPGAKIAATVLLNLLADTSTRAAG